MSTVTDATRVFFSFPEVRPDRHREYDAWHQLDHLPENRALPGVLHGERWVRSPDCRAATDVDDEPTLSAADYVAMYWFREPARASIEEWLALGESTRHQGRRPDLDWTTRRLTGFFRPEAGHVDPAAQVSLAALPFRPARGVVLEAHRGDDATPPPSERVTAGAAVSGVAGSWSFRGRRVTTTPRGELDEPGRLRLTLHWCEDDPVAVLPRVAQLPAAAGATLLLRTPLRTLTPWFPERECAHVS